MSTSVSIVFALSFLSLGSGFHHRKRESGYDQVVQCIDKAFVFGEHSDISEATCYYKVMDPCLDNLEKYADAGTEEALDLFVFYTWQELTLIKKQDLCGDVSSQDLKKFALASGVMQKFNLRNIETDENAKCAKKAFFKCFYQDENRYKHTSYLKQADVYLKCEETQGQSCNAPIWKHYHATVDAWRKLFEDKHGKFS